MLTRRSSANYRRRPWCGPGVAGIARNVSLAANPTGKKLHGLSAFGELKYPPDYTHFDYVNPTRQRAGHSISGFRAGSTTRTRRPFDTLNTLVLKGNAPPRMEMCFDSLMFAENVSAS